MLGVKLFSIYYVPDTRNCLQFVYKLYAYLFQIIRLGYIISIKILSVHMQATKISLENYMNACFAPME